MAEEIRAALRAEVEALGLPVLELPSGAGHDAGILAAAGVPSGMLFVRSLNGGISHNPAELSSPEDIALAVDVLTGALRRLVDVKAVVVRPGEGHRVGNIEFLARSADTPRFNLALIRSSRTAVGRRRTRTRPRTTRSTSSRAN